MLAAVVVAGGPRVTPAQAIADRPECEVEAVYEGGNLASAGIAAVIPLAAGTDPANYPVVADVTCSIVVDGTVSAAATTRATGVAVIAEYREFRYSTTGFKVCTTIDFVSTANATDHWCNPRKWGSGSDDVWDLVYWATLQADPVACPVLQGRSPQTSPDDEVYVDAGDVHVLGWLTWDCPPYEPPAQRTNRGDGSSRAVPPGPRLR